MRVKHPQPYGRRRLTAARLCHNPRLFTFVRNLKFTVQFFLWGLRPNTNQGAMKTSTFTTALAIVGLLSGCAVFAQREPEQPAVREVADAAKAQETPEAHTIRGEVVRVQLLSSTNSSGYLVGLLVQADAKVVLVELGPSWFIENQPIQVAPGDEVEVTGSEFTANGRTAFAAAQLRKDGEILRLHDSNGRPVWRAWRVEPQVTLKTGHTPGQGKGGSVVSGQAVSEATKESATRPEQSKLASSQDILEERLAEMNQATGDAKIGAMANIITLLVNERKQLIHELSDMRRRMQIQARPLPAAPGEEQPERHAGDASLGGGTHIP